MDEAKIKVIKEWPTPKTVSKVRSLYRLTSLYRRFVKDFSTIVALLIKIVNKTIGFKWEIKQEKDFNLLKEKFILAPSLALPNFTKTFKIECNAFSICIRAISM